MCGICGFIDQPNSDLLSAMTQALTHRGPDEMGTWESPEVSLGSRRLSIVDLARGQQPMTSEDGSVVVVYNGEIFNAPELRTRLIQHGHILHTTCDTELIPHLYEERGEDFAHELNGQFAIAVWDKKRHRMILTRDRLGIKPLFYCTRNDRLYFASEIKSILLAGKTRPSINLEALYHYLTFKYVPHPLTIYQGIQSLCPGEQIIFEQGQIKRRTYWEIPHTENLIRDPLQAVDRLDELLQLAIKRQLLSDVPVGVLLSGGLDSSLMVAITSRLMHEPLKTFTLVYEDDFAHKSPETIAARKVSQLFETQHLEHVATHRELLDDLPNIFAAFDEPFATVMSPYFVNKLVSKHVKVCLSGDGADEMFGSYLSHRIAQPIHHIKTFGEKYVRQHPELLTPCESIADRVYQLAQMEDWDWRTQLGVFADVEKLALLSPELEGLQQYSTTQRVRKELRRCTNHDAQNRQQEFDCRTMLPDHVLNYSDKLSMAHSVEIRVPSLDHELVEYALSVAGNLKIHHGCCKWLLKQVARRYLPPEIVDRPKEGFVMPINNWQQTVFESAIRETLTPERLNQHRLFQPEIVQQLVHRYYSGQTDLQYKVWTLFCFQCWYDQVYQSRTTEPCESYCVP